MRIIAKLLLLSLEEDEEVVLNAVMSALGSFENKTQLKEEIACEKLAFLLYTHKAEYSFENSFTQNLKNLYKTEEKIIITQDAKKKYIEYLLKLHEENKLLNCIDNGISLFREIYDKKTN